jgi:hypothetical protein
MVPAIKIPPVHKLASVPAGEVVTWQLAFKVLCFGRLSVQAIILLPAKVAVLPGTDISRKKQNFELHHGALGLERRLSLM